jgi:hypothetical protein
MGALDDFVENLRVHAQKQVPMQTAWVTVDDVTWTDDEKTMDCTGVSDDLEYFDVLLGIGSQFFKPTKGSLCLIGTIANNDAAGYLISAAEVEEIVWVDKSGFEVKLNNGELTLNGDQFGAMIKIDELQNNLDQLKNYVETMSAAIGPAFAAVGAAMSASGAAGQSSYEGATAASSINFSNMENDVIKHG